MVASFISDAERIDYFDVVWSQRDMGVWPASAAVAIADGVQALTRQLDAIVWSALISRPSPDRDLGFEEPIRQRRYRVELRTPDLELVLIDRHALPVELALWSQRFQMKAMADRVGKWMIARERNWPRWARPILEHGAEAFEAHLVQKIVGCADAVRPPSGSGRA